MARKSTPIDRSKLPLNFQLLSDDEIEALRAKAREAVEEEIKQKTRDDFYSRAVDDERRRHVPSEQIQYVFVDVAPFINHILIDGVIYFHGLGYEVPQSVAAVMHEQMSRSWQHQDEIDGRGSIESYRAPRNQVISPRSV